MTRFKESIESNAGQRSREADVVLHTPLLVSVALLDGSRKRMAKMIRTGC